MNTKDNGGPAFPTDPRPVIFSEPMEWANGMTLRDYFAASFLQGYIAVPGALPTAEHSAKRAYEYADAMIKARES